MKKLAHFNLLFTGFLLIWTAQAFPQLSGDYSICSEGCDYESFSLAVSDLKQTGLDGDVLFLVKPGNYNGFNISGLDNPGAHQITFKYDGPGDDSAFIQGSIKIINSDSIALEGFTISPFSYQKNSCVFIDESSWISLTNCHILNLDNANFDSDEALVEVDFPWEGVYYMVDITGCEISSPEETIYMNGKKGKITFRNNVIRGVIDAFGSPYSIYYYDNVFYINDYYFEIPGQYFSGNTFYYDDIGTLWIQGNFYHNTFYTNVYIISDDIIGNTFYKDVELNWLNGADFFSNVVYGEFSSDFSHGIRILNNYLYGNVRMNNDNTNFGNNMVFASVTFSHGPAQLIFNNNFGPDAFLDMSYTSGIVQNNNLSHVNIMQPTTTTVQNNNFIHLGEGNVNFYGTNAHFYDPFYLGDSVMYASNPALIGKGAEIQHAIFKRDIDSVLRKTPCTIGASEICFNWDFDTVVLKCLDSLCLDLCLDTLENQYWSPPGLMDDSISSKPVFYPRYPEMVYLNNVDGSIFDSVYISIGEEQPIAYALVEIIDNMVYFDNQSNCARMYLWEFGDGDISTEESPAHQYPSDGIYQCRLTATNEYGSDYYVIWFDLVGTKENSQNSNGIGLFPNPAHDYLSIVSGELFSEVSIYTLTGRLVFSETMQAVNRFNMQIHELNPGLFVIGVKTSDGVHKLKFIKL